MTKLDPEVHQDCMNRFIGLANTMKDEGVDVQLVSSALMSASGVYETFALVGNEGGLSASGVDKVAEKYKKHVERYQEIRKMEQQRPGGD